MSEVKQDGWSKVEEALRNRMVFMVGGVRSGTTVFRAMLSSHPHIVDRGEVFNSNNQQGYYKFLLAQCQERPELIMPERSEEVFQAYLLSLVPKDPKAMALVDIKYEHLPLLPDAWQLPFSNPALLRLLKRSKLRSIHMRRQNFFSVMSNVMAVNTGRYHLRADQGEAGKPGTPALVQVDRAMVQGQIKRRKRTVELVDQMLAAPQGLSVDYEQVFDPDGSFKLELIELVAQHLGLDAGGFNPQPALKKVIDKPLHELIANFQDIADLQDS